MNHKLEVCKRCECELGKGFHSLFQVVQRFKAILCHSMLGFFYWAVIHFCLILCSKIQEALLLVGIFEIKLSIWVRILDPSPGRGEAMAPHSSPPAWKIPWTEKPGGLQSMRLLRVGQDWSNLAAGAAAQEEVVCSGSHSSKSMIWTCNFGS